MALVSYVRLPTGRNVGNGAVEGGLVVPASYDLSDKWCVEAQLEGDMNYDKDEAEHYLRIVPSAAVDYKFSEWLTGFGEVAGFWDTRQGTWRASLNLAPKLKLNDNVIVDFGTHLALTRESNQEYFLGVSFRR